MTDWCSILDEIIAAGVAKAEVARRLSVARSTLQRWHDGSGRPKEQHAGMLLALHRSLKPKPIRTYEGAIASTSTLMRT